MAGCGGPRAKEHPVTLVTYMASVSRPERTVFRLRKWIIHRLVSLVDHLHLEKDDAVVEQIARCVRGTPCGWHDYETRPLAWSLFGFPWSQKPSG